MLTSSQIPELLIRISGALVPFPEDVLDSKEENLEQPKVVRMCCRNGQSALTLALGLSHFTYSVQLLQLEIGEYQSLLEGTHLNPSSGLCKCRVSI